MNMQKSRLGCENDKIYLVNIEIEEPGEYLGRNLYSAILNRRTSSGEESGQSWRTDPSARLKPWLRRT